MSDIKRIKEISSKQDEEATRKKELLEAACNIFSEKYFSSWARARSTGSDFSTYYIPGFTGCSFFIVCYDYNEEEKIEISIKTVDESKVEGVKIVSTTYSSGEASKLLEKIGDFLHYIELQKVEEQINKLQTAIDIINNTKLELDSNKNK